MIKNIKIDYVIKTIKYHFGNKKLNILDIGCSNDYIYFKGISKKFVGVDVIPPKIIPQIFINQNLEENYKINIKENSFDVILALDILEHLNNRHIVINELKRLIKNDGMIIISLPNEFSYQPVWYHIKGINWISGDEFGHKYFYDINTSENYVKKHLKIIRKKYLYLDGKLKFLGCLNQILAEKFPRWFARNIIYICKR